MREIKFRAWNKEKKIMCYENEDQSSDYLDGWSASDIQVINQTLNSDFTKQRYDFMQYTGLKDKNGKEIYEGDIVEWSGFKMEIFWGEDIGIGYGFCWRPCGDNRYYHESMTGFIDEYEVIGNIYENQDLLKEV